MLLSRDATIFKLGRRVHHTPVMRPRDLDPDRPVFGLDRDELARQNFAPLISIAHAKRRGFTEDEVAHPLAVWGAAEQRQEYAGAVLLHLRRRVEDVERAGGERLL